MRTSVFLSWGGICGPPLPWGSPRIPLAALAALLLAGCSPEVRVQPPDKPIEINVNVKIEHEVRVKLDRAVDETLTENPELFGVEAVNE